MVVMDFDTPFCPVCDRQIAPKRTTQLITTPPTGTLGAARRNAPNRPLTKTKTVIDQGPFPLYCSDECKMADISERREEIHQAPTYHIYHSKQEASPSDIESDSLSSMSMTTTTDASCLSPTSPAISSSTPITCQPKQRSRSFLTGRELRSSSARHIPSSLPTGTSSTLLNDYEGNQRFADQQLLSQFQGSFSRRSESRVSMYSGPSSPSSRSPPSLSDLSTSPRRERPLLAHGAQGKLLVPDVYVRIPSRPSTSRRESSSSLASIASAPEAMTSRHRTGSVASMASFGSSRGGMTSSLTRYGNDSGEDEKSSNYLSEEDEYDEDPDAQLNSGFVFALMAKRPQLADMRAQSFDAFPTVRATRKERRSSDKKEDRRTYNPDGKKLFLFPTD